LPAAYSSVQDRGSTASTATLIMTASDSIVTADDSIVTADDLTGASIEALIADSIMASVRVRSTAGSVVELPDVVRLAGSMVAEGSMVVAERVAAGTGKIISA
jgi:hypothetical protein